MPLQRAYLQVDVFTNTPYLGNPLGVVLDGSGLSDEVMQQFARWTNLSETTFLLPPTPEALAQGADYQVRIFTPAYEMAFAGHPTVGSCHAWLAQGGVARNPERIVQQCKVGLVKIRPSRNSSSTSVRLAFAAPPLTRTHPGAAVLAQAAAALGLRSDQVLAAQLMNNGPSHLGLLVDSVDTVLSTNPNFSALQTGLPQWGVTGIGMVALQDAQTSANLIVRSNREARAFTGSGSGAEQRTAQEPTAEVRFFFAGDNVVSEDRVTGSFNASLAQWLIAEGHAPRGYVAQQGCCLGGDGRVHIAIDEHDQVWVGGDVVTCISGLVNL